jgi:hypothetical protein
MPSDLTTGALWQGKGYTWHARAGLNWVHGGFSVQLSPVWFQTQNRVFEEDPKDFDGIYLPSRLHEGSYSSWDWGDSRLQYEYSSLHVELSHANRWMGPAIWNPLLLGNHAPGFWHVSLSSRNPVPVPAGLASFSWFLGQIEPLKQRPSTPPGISRMINGWSVSYQPELLPGLEVGLQQVFYGDAGFPVMARGALPKTHESDREGMWSVFMNWSFPEVGLETYAEWGRQGERRSLYQVYLEPDVNRGYVMGLTKRLQAGKGLSVILNAEITQLENSSVSFFYQETQTWYQSPRFSDGYTHRGQVLGSGIGPGSSIHTARIYLKSRYGYAGFSMGRVVHHNDRLYNNAPRFERPAPPLATLRLFHEVEMRYGNYVVVYLPSGLELELTRYRSFTENRYNIRFNDVNNTHLRATLRYRI